ncbi:MAG: hypothetical protein HZB16_12260 [Armatimonadetes bacterium]|nr:hypothetical protein [Armatimonadota bacterium]
MRPLDEDFVKRVRETSLVLAGVGFLTLASMHAALPALASYAAGVALSLLVWYSAEQAGRRLGAEMVSRREKLLFGGLYLAKYGLAALVIWSLRRADLVDGLAFTGGFSIPLLTVMLKAFGWQTLSHEVDPVPFYSRSRRPRKVG